MDEHILITAIDSPDKHGLEGVVVRQPTEALACAEFLLWADILAAEWEIICVSIVSVGGEDDPYNDGQLLSSFTVAGGDGANRAESLRSMMLLKAKAVGRMP